MAKQEKTKENKPEKKTRAYKTRQNKTEQDTFKVSVRIGVRVG
jgi:hypothetical protein